MKLICDHAQVCTPKTCYHQDIHDELNGCDNYTYFCKGSEVTCEPIYVLGKNLISRKSVYDTLPKNCKEALEIYENFEHRFKFSLGFDEAIPLGSVIDFLKDKPQKVTDWFVEKGFLAKKLEETYSIGDRFMKEGALNEYILGVIDFNTVALINLTTGGGYSPPIQVNNIERITEEELAKITPYAKFTRVHKRK